MTSYLNLSNDPLSPVAPTPVAVAGLTVRNVYLDASGGVSQISDTGTITKGLTSGDIGIANGVAGLDGSGKVPSAQLPSYVDDVLEFANLAAFPALGETGKIYIAIDTGFEYRWSGSIYVKLSQSPVISVFGRTNAVTAQAGDYTAAQVTNTPAGNITTATAQLALNELDTLKAQNILTPLSLASTADVVATDTVVIALGKLQAKLNKRVVKSVATLATNSSSVTLTNLTDLTFTVVAGRKYRFSIGINAQTVAATTGLVLTIVAGGATVGTIAALVSLATSGDATNATFIGHITALGDLVVGPTMPVAALAHYNTIDGTFNCTTGGTLIVAFRSEVNASAVQVNVGSFGIVEEV